MKLSLGMPTSTFYFPLSDPIFYYQNPRTCFENCHVATDSNYITQLVVPHGTRGVLELPSLHHHGPRMVFQYRSVYKSKMFLGTLNKGPRSENFSTADPIFLKLCRILHVHKYSILIYIVILVIMSFASIGVILKSKSVFSKPLVGSSLITF